MLFYFRLMKSKINLNILLVCITVLSIALLMSFKQETEKQVAILKVYQNDTDFGNAIVTAYPKGTVERVELLPNTHKNYEANDKLIQKAINGLIKLEYKLTNVTTINNKNIMITQFVFE